MSFAGATGILLILYSLTTIFLVYRGAKSTKDIKDFALGKGFSPWVVGLSLAASSCIWMECFCGYVRSLAPGFIYFIDYIEQKF